MNYFFENSGYSGLNRNDYPEMRQKGNIERFISLENQAFCYLWQVKLRVNG